MWALDETTGQQMSSASATFGTQKSCSERASPHRTRRPATLPPGRTVKLLERAWDTIGTEFASRHLAGSSSFSHGVGQPPNDVADVGLVSVQRSAAVTARRGVERSLPPRMPGAAPHCGELVAVGHVAAPLARKALADAGNGAAFVSGRVT